MVGRVRPATTTPERSQARVILVVGVSAVEPARRQGAEPAKRGQAVTPAGQINAADAIRIPGRLAHVGRVVKTASLTLVSGRLAMRPVPGPLAKAS